MDLPIWQSSAPVLEDSKEREKRKSPFGHLPNLERVRMHLDIQDFAHE